MTIKGPVKVTVSRVLLLLLLLAPLACASPQGPERERCHRLSEHRLKDLIADGFAGSVLGIPKLTTRTVSLAGERLFGPSAKRPSDIFGELLPHHRGASLESRRNKPGYESVLAGVLKEQQVRSDDKRLSWSALSIQSIAEGDVKDLELIYEELITREHQWLPYFRLYWYDTLELAIKRRAVFLRPRFAPGLTLEQQLEVLGIKAAAPVWVHPRIGMIYQVVEPWPKSPRRNRPVFFLTTTPKLGRPRVEAVMDGIAADIAKLKGFVIYQSIEASAFHVLNEQAHGAQAYEPFLACHVLNRDIQRRLARLTRSARGRDSTELLAALAALRRHSDLYRRPLMLKDAERAASKQGLLSRPVKRRLLRYALETLASFDRHIQDCQEKRLYATEAGAQWIKSAFVGSPFEQGFVNVEARAESTTPLQRALANRAQTLPVPRLPGRESLRVSDNLMVKTHAGAIARLRCFLSASNFKRRIAAGAPVWTFKLPRPDLQPEALTARIVSRTVNWPYQAPTKASLEYSARLQKLEQELQVAFDAIPMESQIVTRDKWLRTKRKPNQRNAGSNWQLLAIKTEASGRNWLSPEAERYSALKSELYQLQMHPPAIRTVTKSTPLPVKVQLWSLKPQAWRVELSCQGRVLGTVPAAAEIRRERFRHSGSKAMGIPALDEWSQRPAMMKALRAFTLEAVVAKIERRGSLRALDFADAYLALVCPQASPEERALEAAWMGFWFRQESAVTAWPPSMRRRLPVRLLSELLRDRSALELGSVSWRYPARRQDARVLYPLNDRSLRGDFKTPGLVIDRPGALSKIKVHVDVSVERLAGALRVAGELSRHGATFTQLTVRGEAGANAVQYGGCVNDSAAGGAREVYDFLESQPALRSELRFERGESGSCPQCGEDMSLRGPTGGKLEWRGNAIHIRN